MTLSEAAARLGVDRPSPQRLIDEGTLPSIKIGRRTLVTRHKIEAMLAD